MGNSGGSRGMGGGKEGDTGPAGSSHTRRLRGQLFPSIWVLIPDPPRGPSAPGWRLRGRCGADALLPLTLRRESRSTLGRRFAFEEDGEERREALRNGIDLDINPGRLPPPPEPWGRAAAARPAARAPGRRARRDRASRTRAARGRGPSGQPLAASRAATPRPRPRRQQVSLPSRSAGDSALPARAAGRLRRSGSLEAAKPPVPGQARPRSGLE